MQELIFRSKAKPEDLDDHWVSYVEELSIPPQEFYAKVEQAISASRLPGLVMSRIEFGEGGLLSDRRLYLRMFRDRLTFDVCAASFGRTFFFSCRSFVMPVVVQLWHLLLLLGFFLLLFAALVRPLGITFAGIAVVTLVLAIVQVMRNTWSQGSERLDTLLRTTAVIGPIYERWFRRETYYRRDTYIVYRTLVGELVRKLAADVTAEKGLLLVKQYERAPVVGGLYRPVLSPVSPKPA